MPHGIRLSVPDESINPAVDYMDLDLIDARMNSLGDVESKWCVPGNAHIATIHRNGGQVSDRAKIELEMRLMIEPRGGRDQASAVDRRSREVPDLRIRVCR